MEILLKRDLISKNSSISFEEFAQVKLIIGSIFFIFNKFTISRFFYIPMNSLLLVIIADLVVQDLENTALE